VRTAAGSQCSKVQLAQAKKSLKRAVEGTVESEGRRASTVVCSALYDELLRQELVRRCLAPQVAHQVTRELGQQEDWLRVASAVETALCNIFVQPTYEFVTTRGLRVKLQLEVVEVTTEVPSTPTYEH
jgi:hypothetical protein